jgi:hypothetical protein
VWLRLVASLPVLAFLMLSGFLLRGDADAQQARRILRGNAGPAAAGRAGCWRSFCWAATAVRCRLPSCSMPPPPRSSSGWWWWNMRGASGAARAPGCWPWRAAARWRCWCRPACTTGKTPAVKGPWYFLGLQELLHWSSWPAWLLLAGAALLLLLAWIPEAQPRAARRAPKAACYAVVALYFVLCLAVLFARGANWSLAPAWPAGPGDLRAGPVLEHVTVDAAKVALPMVLGRPRAAWPATPA